MAGETMKDALQTILRQAIDCVAEEFYQKIPQDIGIPLSVPPSDDLGDYSSNVAMLLAKLFRTSPMRLAEAIIRNVKGEAGPIAWLEVKPPGFINIFLSSNWWRQRIIDVLSMGGDYGIAQTREPQKVQIEFVSANPVGPLNVVSARAAALGDSLANLLSAVGHEVQREYLINDAGNQVTLFGESVLSRYFALIGHDYPFPENGYLGDYITDVAEWVFNEHGAEFEAIEDEGVRRRFVDISLGRMIENQRQTLLDYGVVFDVWFSERALRAKGGPDDVKAILKERGSLFREDGALWFEATNFGDKRDRVLVKRDGEATYLLGDLAYHRDKYQRGFDLIIDILGPDHQGQVAGILGGIEALGLERRKTRVMISGHVRLLRDGKTLAMSKRAGDFISMNDLLQDVGKDAARFFFLLRTASAHLDFDLDLAKKQTPENPVYYVQYAHARVRSIFRKAAELGMDPGDLIEADLSLLSDDEAHIAKRLCRFPEMIERAASKHEPHLVCYYLMELAGDFHRYYNKTKVLTNDPEVTSARLALSEAVRRVIEAGLKIIGVSAPDAM